MCSHRNATTFYVRYRVGKQQKQVKAGNRLSDAQRKLTEIQSELNNGTYIERKDITFNEFVDKWLHEYGTLNWKPSTYENNVNTIECHLRPAIGRFYLRNLTKQRIQTLVSDLARKRSAKTVNNVLVLLRTILKHAVKLDYLRENPALAIDKLRVERKEMEFLTPHEIQLLIQHADEHYKTLFIMAALTGMRRGELLAAQWGDIDWNRSMICVRRNIYWFRAKGVRERNKRWKFVTPKTERSFRPVVMTPSLKQTLELHRIEAPVSKHDLIFCNADGEPLDPDNMRNRYFKTALRFAGIRDVPFHALRHSYASMLIAQGENIKFIQSQLGHASAHFTIDRYGHLFDINAEEVGKKLDAQLDNSHVNTMSTKVPQISKNSMEQQQTKKITTLAIPKH